MPIVSSDRCSTPEGIGGGIRTLQSRRKLASNSAQRPKASEGESGKRNKTKRRKQMKCSTPEGIGGGIRSPSSIRTIGSATCAQRPKASEGESVVNFVDPARSQVVCSTPEGIGGGIRLPVFAGHECRRGCSTPEGIGGGIRPAIEPQALESSCRAQRPKASEGESVRRECSLARFTSCSTPEGIGGGISILLLTAIGMLHGAQRPKASEGESDYLIDGNFTAAPCAQRPKASEGESDTKQANSGGAKCVLNARRHRRGNQDLTPAVNLDHGRCSTPEGIGGGISQCR